MTMGILKTSHHHAHEIYDKGGSIDRSCYIGLSWTTNNFNLNYSKNALTDIYFKEMDNQIYFSIHAKS